MLKVYYESTFGGQIAANNSKLNSKFSEFYGSENTPQSQKLLEIIANSKMIPVEHVGHVSHYDAYTGRWTNRDLILFNGRDTNLYGYVMNDPINFIDLRGTYAVPSTLGTGGNGAGFIDVNFTVGLGIGITAGGYYRSNGQFFPYFGAGLMSGSGASVMYSPNIASSGFGVSGQAGFGLGVGGGYSFSDGSHYVEGGVTTPGASLTGEYVCKPDGGN